MCGEMFLEPLLVTKRHPCVLGKYQTCASYKQYSRSALTYLYSICNFNTSCSRFPDSLSRPGDLSYIMINCLVVLTVTSFSSMMEGEGIEYPLNLEDYPGDTNPKQMSIFQMQ